MSDSRRRVIGIAALALLLAALATFGIWRFRTASRLGWAGFTYMPSTSRRDAPAASFGYSPGGVIILYPGGPAERAGIERGDKILAIDGIPTGDIPRLAGIAASAHTGTVLTYTVERNGAKRMVRLRFESPTSASAVLVVIAINVVVAITFLTIGVFVFLRRPSDSRAVVFYAMTLIAAASFVSGALAQIDTANGRGIVVQPSIGSMGGSLIIAATAAFFAPLLLHLALIFPLERPVLKRRRRTVFEWIYGVPLYLTVCIVAFLIAVEVLEAQTRTRNIVVIIAIVIVSVVGILTLVSIVRIAMRARAESFREAVIRSPFEVMTMTLALLMGLMTLMGYVSHRLHSPGMIIAMSIIGIFATIALFAVYPVATVIALFRSYRESGAEERRQVKWPLWGTMVAVGGRIVMLVIGLFMGVTLAFGGPIRFSSLAMTAPDLVAKTLYTLIPLSFAFAILKYRLMNIDVIIRRTVMYTMLTGVIFVLYAVLVAGLGTALVKFANVKNQTVLIASTAVIALVAVPLRNRLQQLVDRNLFRERGDFALALRNVSNAIGTSTAVDAFLRYSTEQVQQALQSRFALIAIRREAEFVAAAKVGLADEIVGSLRIAADAVPFEAREVPEALRRIGTALVVPIAAHRQPTGLLALGSRLSDEEFSPADVEFVMAAAAQIAVGIENVRLRDEEADFEQARAMQQILLPKSIPQIAGFEITGLWQPARSVGGDYFDVLPLGEGRLGVCIADVAGKGMPAALLMANLQAAVKACASYDAAPSAVCERVKAIVSGNLAGGKFISFFYAVLDAPARTLTYCNAGHNPPIVSRSGGIVERLMSGGPALCRLFRDAQHVQDAIELQHGDRVILFTDGVSEARRGEDEFGEDRLVQMILTHRHCGAKELEQKILTRLREYTAGDFSDDVTMIVIAAE